MSRNPYIIDEQEPTLCESVFVFMDILGYSDLMLQSQNVKQEQPALRDLHSALSASRKRLESQTLFSVSRKDFYALKSFTDNIVIGWPVHSDAQAEFGIAFPRLAEFQFNMAIRGYFLRGAISVAPAYVDEVVVFGDALAQAYKGESILARDPRIIFTDSAVRAVERHLKYYSHAANAPHVRDILKDADGQWFLNYLESVLIAEDKLGPLYNEFMQHKIAVEKKLSEHTSNPEIWAKYAWVAGYHNYFCDLHTNHFDDEHRVNIELFKSTPSLIAGEDDVATEWGL
ncbi:MAG: hypothetical protein WCH30_06295 [Chlorobiaceae bacterium]